MSIEGIVKKKGQYICPACNKPMNKIGQSQFTFIEWEWNIEEKRYIKKDNQGDSERPVCVECDCSLPWELGEELGY